MDTNSTLTTSINDTSSQLMSNSSSMDTPGKRAKRSRNWTTRETNLLIEKWKENMQDLKATGERRRSAIGRVETAFTAAGYGRNSEQIRKKMENLVEMYKSMKGKIGSSSPILWEHYDVLDVMFNSEEYLSTEKVEINDNFETQDASGRVSSGGGSMRANHSSGGSASKTSGAAKRAKRLRKLAQEVEEEGESNSAEIRALRDIITKGYDQLSARLDAMEASIHLRQDALESKVMNSLYGTGFQH